MEGPAIEPEPGIRLLRAAEVFEGVGGLDPVRALQAPGEDRTELGGFDPGLDRCLDIFGA